MKNIDLAEIGALVGDPARAAMIEALMDGRALTAGELAFHRPRLAADGQRASAPALPRRAARGVKQGRHRYFRIASPLVAQMMESIGVVAAIEAPPRAGVRCRASTRRSAKRACATTISPEGSRSASPTRMIRRGFLALDADGGEVTPAGFAFFDDLGIDLETPHRGRRAFCRPCLDWSERRFHIAGHTGAALARQHCERRAGSSACATPAPSDLSEAGSEALGLLA